MLHNTEFIRNLMAHYSYPQEAEELFIKVLNHLDEDKDFGDRFDALHEKFSSYKSRFDSEIISELKIIAEEKGYSEYTLCFVFLLSLTEELHEQYVLLGIDEKVYYDTMDDLRCKLLECMECEYVPGTFVPDWFDGFFRLKRIAYGRFQYELCRFNSDKEFTLKCGHVIKPGDIYVNFHIPSSGVSLSNEVRLVSYKEAYKHFKPLFPDGTVIFGCGSWLLYPRHREFLPEGMNILNFMDDFETVNWNERDDFHNDWRIFGHYSDLPWNELPKDTKLRKAYAEWICAGNKVGDAFGVFAFDGEKILK